MKKSKPNLRKHIPALNPDQLAQAIDKLQAAKLPPAAKQQLERMLRAAANPDSESVEVIIQTLPNERRKRIQAMTADLTRQTRNVTGRARQSLLDMPDDEWERLVEEANNTDA